jgi:hypothetical protein
MLGAMIADCFCGVYGEFECDELGLEFGGGIREVVVREFRLGFEAKSLYAVKRSRPSFDITFRTFQIQQPNCFNQHAFQGSDKMNFMTG